MQTEIVHASCANHEGLSAPINRRTTERFEMRPRRHMRLQKLYGAQEVLLELAIFTVILGTACAICVLRRHLVG